MGNNCQNIPINWVDQQILEIGVNKSNWRGCGAGVNSWGFQLPFLHDSVPPREEQFRMEDKCEENLQCDKCWAEDDQPVYKGGPTQPKQDGRGWVEKEVDLQLQPHLHTWQLLFPGCVHLRLKEFVIISPYHYQ